MGRSGAVCGRPAVKLDLDDRPVCDLRQLQNLYAHTERVHPDLLWVPSRPSSAAAVPPLLAPAAQDPPKGEPDSGADAGESDQPLTRGAARELIDDALEAFARDVLRLPAAMAQDPGVAVHAVGLCGDGTCAPCSSQRRAEHLQARQLFADELDHAIEWRGRGKAGELLARDGSDALGDILEGWRGAGRPGPDPEPPGPSEQIEVVR